MNSHFSNTLAPYPPFQTERIPSLRRLPFIQSSIDSAPLSRKTRPTEVNAASVSNTKGKPKSKRLKLRTDKLAILTRHVNIHDIDVVGYRDGACYAPPKNIQQDLERLFRKIDSISSHKDAVVREISQELEFEYHHLDKDEDFEKIKNELEPLTKINEGVNNEIFFYVQDVDKVVRISGSATKSAQKLFEDIAIQNILSSKLRLAPKIQKVFTTNKKSLVIMEKIQGITLEDWSCKKKHSLSEHLRMTITTLKATYQMHELGIIHGDLHTQNVMIIPKTRSVVFIDFETSHYKPEAIYSYPKKECSERFYKVIPYMIIGTPIYNQGTLSEMPNSNNLVQEMMNEFPEVNRPEDLEIQLCLKDIVDMYIDEKSSKNKDHGPPFIKKLEDIHQRLSRRLKYYPTNDTSKKTETLQKFRETTLQKSGIDYEYLKNTDACEVFLQKFSRLELVSTNGYSYTYKCQDLPYLEIILTVPDLSTLKPQQLQSYEIQNIIARDLNSATSIKKIIESENSSIILVEKQKGEPLEKWLQEDPRSLQKCLYVAKNYLKLLKSLHERGIQHGRIGIKNLMINPETLDIQFLSLEFIRYYEKENTLENDSKTSAELVTKLLSVIDIYIAYAKKDSMAENMESTFPSMISKIPHLKEWFTKLSEEIIKAWKNDNSIEGWDKLILIIEKFLKENETQLATH